MANGQNQLAQTQLLPVEAIFCGPVNFGSADAGDGCFCHDGSGYIMKEPKPSNPKSPHNEWLCANLALKAGVPIAPFNIVKHTSGQMWFGSQYRIGEIPDWWQLVKAGSIDIEEIRDDLSAIYALDLFIYNVDRHIKNFLVINDGVTHRALAIDHGRAWMYGSFPVPDPPFDPNSNTFDAFSWIRGEFDKYPVKTILKDILTTIGKIPHDYIEDILTRQPTYWLNGTDTDAILSWWKGGGAVDRAKRLVEGVDDGSLV